ncbi:MAG: site-specific integrase [Chloroflexi bacterium]|nr:site-specific integrase [Chloroflexota bacterium]
MKLTAAAVEKIKPPPSGQIEYFDQLLPSFGLRVSSKGAKSWFLMTRVEGKLIRMTLGKARAMPLAKARDEARRLMNMAASGKDPRLEKSEAKRMREEQRRSTFGVCAAEFLERYVATRLRPSTMREYKRILTGPDTRHWQGRPISSITKREVLDVIEKMEGRGSPGAASRALAYLGRFFNWCAERDIIEVVPTDRIRPSHPATKRDRVLSEDELAYLIRAIEEEQSVFGPLFMVLLMTGQRRGEVAGMRWSEIRDFDTGEALWEIPGERTKNKQAHLVPLPPAVCTVLKTLPRTGDLVFTTTGETPVSGFGKAKARLDARIDVLRKEDGLEGMPPWTLHDLRRTMVTMMNEKLGIMPHVVEAVVNHVSGLAKAGVAGVYNRALYLDERRRTLDVWSEFISEL